METEGQADSVAACFVPFTVYDKHMLDFGLQFVNSVLKYAMSIPLLQECPSFCVCVLSVFWCVGNASKTSQHMSQTPSNTVLLVWRGSSYVDNDESGSGEKDE